MPQEAENLQIVRRYLAAIEKGAGFDEMSEFFTPHILQIEYPNRFVPEGARQTATDSFAPRGGQL